MQKKCSGNRRKWWSEDFFWLPEPIFRFLLSFLYDSQNPSQGVSVIFKCQSEHFFHVSMS